MKTPQKDRWFTIKLPHFNYDVKVAFTDDFKAFALNRGWEKLYEQIKNDDRTVSAYHCSHPGEGTSWILYKHDPNIDTIVHEVFHVVWRIMKYIGADFENEVMAYHVGYIVKRITSNLFKFDSAYQDLRDFSKKKSDKMSK